MQGLWVGLRLKIRLTLQRGAVQACVYGALAGLRFHLKLGAKGDHFFECTEL